MFVSLSGAAEVGAFTGGTAVLPRFLGPADRAGRTRRLAHILPCANRSVHFLNTSINYPETQDTIVALLAAADAVISNELASPVMIARKES